jgi:hypothetical protein
LWAFIIVQRGKTDAMWKLSEKELIYANPPVVLGRGSFGLVLQADCRGTCCLLFYVLLKKANLGLIIAEQALYFHAVH